MPALLHILIEPGPESSLCDSARTLPARPGVIAFEKGDTSTVLLAATGNLRRFALTRLGEPDGVTPAKREDLSPVTARLRARVVGASFEGDALYLEEARTRLPEAYRATLDTRKAWCLHLDPEASPPVWRRVDLVGACARGQQLSPGALFGPIREHDSASRLGEHLDDLFDLCRTPKELEAAPHGRACAYKEMGRCDAPCDGSASMDVYRERVRDAARFISTPVSLSLSAVERRMERAAIEQDYELASALNERARRIRKGAGPATSWTTSLDRFAVLGAFPSTRRAWARLFICTARHIDTFADVRGDLTRSQADELLSACAARARSLLDREPAALRPDEAERLGLLSHALFHPPRAAGGMISLDPMSDASALGTLVRRAAKVRDESESPDTPPDTLRAELGPGAGA